MLLALRKNTKLAGLAAHRRDLDRTYLKLLSVENLLLPFYQEAGLHGITYLPENLHNGWDSPLSQIRGTFCGHWLSAAAMICEETNDLELKVRADHIVEEIALCQSENGGEWCFSIPEKYLLWLKKGKHTWAPQYVCHKVMMGLLDMYRYAGNELALSVVKKAAQWFLRFTDDITEEQMLEMMSEETGGMMELWADLYAITGDPAHLTLMRRYERRDLYRSLLSGQDPLSNMHANTTIPEIHGAARAYEVTGEEQYREIVERYWQQAVEKSVPFVTGGQTSGEIWTPPGHHAARLGRMNQEHCTVYNMMRLADYLFRWTGETKYADYWEKNFWNGILAQGFWEEPSCPQLMEPAFPKMTHYVAYYLPLEAGAHKAWGSATGDFWCCHCTLVQANAFLNQGIYFQDGNTIFISQYLESSVRASVGETAVEIVQQPCDQANPTVRITLDNVKHLGRPDCWEQMIRITAAEKKVFSVAFRCPQWVSGAVTILINGSPVQPVSDGRGNLVVTREWSTDQVTIVMPKAITYYPLADDPSTGAFLDGPIALAALTEEERTLYYRQNPAEILVPCDERRWGQWLSGWKTSGQAVNLRFVPLYEIGDQRYTTYFPMEQRK